MTQPPYPEKYWHCCVALPGPKKQSRTSVVNDLSFAELRRIVLDPWINGTRFVVSGLVVSNRELVEEIRVVHTPSPASVYIDQHYAEMNAAGIADLATDGRCIPFGGGTDFTQQLLFALETVSAPAPGVALLLQLCERLPQASRFLATRRAGKPPYTITDEYDVQDLLHAVIRAYFKYSVDEEPLAKVGGGRSGRADLAIPDLNTLIEVKYVHGPKDQQRIIEEFAQDLLLYTAWQPLENFIYLVYNSADLRDAEAVSRLQGNGNTEVNGKRYRTSIVLA